jgi:hypothetical protein
MRPIKSVRHYLGEIEEATYHHATPDDQKRSLIALGRVELIEAWIADLVQELHKPESGWKDDSECWFDFMPVTHALKSLKAFFRKSAPTSEDRLTAIAFARFLSVAVPKLEEKYLDITAIASR